LKEEIKKETEKRFIVKVHTCKDIGVVGGEGPKDAI